MLEEKSHYIIYIYHKNNQYSSQLRLQKAAATFVDEDADADLSLWEIERTKEGKPFFINFPQIHFSISHSKDYWLAVFGNRPLGLDLQYHENCSASAISRRFFHPDEDQFLKRNSYKDFFSVWAAKESYVKFTGQGIWDGLASFSVIDENGIVEKIADAQLRFLPFLSDYTLCLCSTEIDEISFVQLD